MMEQRRRETLSFVCQGNVVITTSLKPRLNPLAANNQLNNDSWLHVEVGFNRATCMVILSVDKEGKANWKKRKTVLPKMVTMQKTGFTVSVQLNTHSWYNDVVRRADTIL